MSIQPVSALVAAIVSFAIGGSVLLREPRRRAHVLFATFTFNIALWSALSFVAKRFDSPMFTWASLLAAVSLPATAQRFFQAFLGDEAGAQRFVSVDYLGDAPSEQSDVQRTTQACPARELPKGPLLRQQRMPTE